jgi:competence protein ComEA
MPALKHPHWLLSRRDQPAVACLVLISLAGIGVWIFIQGGFRQRMIDADQSEKQIFQFQVDLNKAELPELIQLPGIGEVLAGRIVASRQKDGPFADLDDLRRIRGIGPKTMEHLRPYLLPLPGKANVAGVKR